MLLIDNLVRGNSVFRCCSSTGWDTPIIPQLAPHKHWTVMDSQCHTLVCLIFSFFFSFFSPLLPRMLQSHKPPAESMTTSGSTTHSLHRKWSASVFLMELLISYCDMVFSRNQILWFYENIFERRYCFNLFYRDTTLGRQSLSLLHPLNQLYYRHLWSRTQKWVRQMHFSVFK